MGIIFKCIYDLLAKFSELWAKHVRTFPLHMKVAEAIAPTYEQLNEIVELWDEGQRSIIFQKFHLANDLTLDT